ncbi:hypothetical protein JB92DRAFT_2948891 [Gautieria morchelliformis]|nr:hypothetical protein JB92DRAFT_2948891 [Gautieria morchelliformis]
MAAPKRERDPARETGVREGESQSENPAYHCGVFNQAADGADGPHDTQAQARHHSELTATATTIPVPRPRPRPHGSHNGLGLAPAPAGAPRSLPVSAPTHATRSPLPSPRLSYIDGTGQGVSGLARLSGVDVDGFPGFATRGPEEYLVDGVDGGRLSYYTDRTSYYTDADAYVTDRTSYYTEADGAEMVTARSTPNREGEEAPRPGTADAEDEPDDAFESALSGEDEDDGGEDDDDASAISRPRTSTISAVSQATVRRGDTARSGSTMSGVSGYTLRPGTPPQDPVHGPNVAFSIPPHPNTVVHPVPTPGTPKGASSDGSVLSVHTISVPGDVAFPAVPAAAAAPGAHTQLGGGHGADAARVRETFSSLHRFPTPPSTTRVSFSGPSHSHSRASTSSGSAPASGHDSSTALVSHPGSRSGLGSGLPSSVPSTASVAGLSAYAGLPGALNPNPFATPNGSTYNTVTGAHGHGLSYVPSPSPYSSPFGFAPQYPLDPFSSRPADEGDPFANGVPEPDVPMPTTLLRGPVDKPWMEPTKEWGWRKGKEGEAKLRVKSELRGRASWWITVLTACLGPIASAYICYLGWIDTPVLNDANLCLIMEDNFDTFSVDTPGATWMREVDLGGFGNGDFEMTTPLPANAFVNNSALHILPTLTALSIPGGNASVFDGYTYNATGCTSTNFEGTGCGARSNLTSGTIINPVMSARLTTRQSHSIRYGKVEIRAKMPLGDWLWPALWMLPVNETYGPWPMSGEIDIVESRGNGPQYPAQGNNFVRGSLNWGPTFALNAVSKTFGWWEQRRSSYSQGFHTYSLEWTPDFLRIFVDTRLNHMLDLRFDRPFFDRGHFPPTIQNNSQIVALPNPWLNRPNSAPFDQPFFLILNVAVGGTNGWFPDNMGGKPWVDGSQTAMRDFALAQDKWYSTWPTNPEDRAMVIDYVKMWQLC